MIIDSPAYAGETDALLKLLADQPSRPDLDPYEQLLLDRQELPDPELAGTVDPRTRPRDLEIELPGRTLDARVYHPVQTTGPAPVLLWLHGGGFVGGHWRDIEYATSGIAAAGNVVVVSLNYRLEPEKPYPAALNDVHETLQWIHARTTELRGDGRIAIGGQSAGAELAMAACMVARDNGTPLPAHQILCYPCPHPDQDSMSFDGLPPALVLAAGRDSLRDDALESAARLDARLVEYADTMHAFLNFPAALSAGRHAVELISEHLREVFYPPA
ncbi:hypothetical protein E1263_21150 [Kribbella antibiotica]|uniref:Alpha/beta hydrolase fold-3 domain-containing protein n=1 Tax=Kribbella antibiotica TaxID=190195 RepID=A0A4R4ZM98_9ACTN|nr:alpha/beta hydrolase fold domain-containing protein [Kribbella antibiotica]TDD57972.1 hypothetical protein E1263_21150 [Kribbella antibiotica]